MASLPERTVESWLAVELETWFPGVHLWAPTQNSIGNWDLGALGAGKVLIFECKGCQSLVQGHTIPINRKQLWRYTFGPHFTSVRVHVFYVLPSPPWPGNPPGWSGAQPPGAALPVPHAAERTMGVGGGCWNWFYVTTPSLLWAALAGMASVNTCRLPNASRLGLPQHRWGPLGGMQRLSDFLEDVARCRRVPVTGATDADGPEPDRDWRRPRGREPLDEEQEGDLPVEPARGQSEEPPSDDAREAAPTPLAAFIPIDALAT